MAPEKTGYAYIWQYVVDPDSVEDFEHAYGPDGPWVELFSRARGYVRTELYQDRHDPLRYLTIDCWESVEACEGFRNLMASEYAQIDELCERYTLEEKNLGRLFPPSESPG